MPEITPVELLRLSPDGSDGLTVKPPLAIAPPLLDIAVEMICVPAVIDCTELEIDIEGAASGVVTVITKVTFDEPAGPDAVIV